MPRRLGRSDIRPPAEFFRKSALPACGTSKFRGGDQSNEGLAEVRIKTDYLNAKILSHRANLQRYARLLATQLTELEREYLHKRIAEEQAEVARVELLREAKAAKPKRRKALIAPNPLAPPASPRAPLDS
jgi:hypothetical protein